MHKLINLADTLDNLWFWGRALDVFKLSEKCFCIVMPRRGRPFGYRMSISSFYKLLLPMRTGYPSAHESVRPVFTMNLTLAFD